MEIYTNNAEKTAAAGKKLGSSLKPGAVLAFQGDLGAGKTTFIQGLAKGLNIKSRITSPTFIIMREYELTNNSYFSGEANFYHIDLYRLEKNIKRELENLGILDLIKEDKHIFAIEWAEKATDFLPKQVVNIKFEDLGDDNRKIIFDK